MPRNVANENLPYFCTITVLDSLPVLIESRYIDPLVDSLEYCRKRKGLKLFGFVVMPNHVHLICAADNLHEVFRDYKRFTSRTIHDRLKADSRNTILAWLASATQRARRQRDELGLWKDGFHPKAIPTRTLFDQKLRYLHANPVRKGLVQVPDDWCYSSARFYAHLEPCCMALDPIDI